jgi:hypothetical protein
MHSPTLRRIGLPIGWWGSTGTTRPVMLPGCRPSRSTPSITTFTPTSRRPTSSSRPTLARRSWRAETDEDQKARALVTATRLLDRMEWAGTRPTWTSRSRGRARHRAGRRRRGRGPAADHRRLDRARQADPRGSKVDSSPSTPVGQHPAPEGRERRASNTSSRSTTRTRLPVEVWSWSAAYLAAARPLGGARLRDCGESITCSDFEPGSISMRAANLLRSGDHYRADVFAAGLRRHGFVVEAKWQRYPPPGGPLLIWNRAAATSHRRNLRARRGPGPDRRERLHAAPAAAGSIMRCSSTTTTARAGGSSATARGTRSRTSRGARAATTCSSCPSAASASAASPCPRRGPRACSTASQP